MSLDGWFVVLVFGAVTLFGLVVALDLFGFASRRTRANREHIAAGKYAYGFTLTNVRQARRVGWFVVISGAVGIALVVTLSV